MKRKFSEDSDIAPHIDAKSDDIVRNPYLFVQIEDVPSFASMLNTTIDTKTKKSDASDSFTFKVSTGDPSTPGGVRFCHNGLGNAFVFRGYLKCPVSSPRSIDEVICLSSNSLHTLISEMNSQNRIVTLSQLHMDAELIHITGRNTMSEKYLLQAIFPRLITPDNGVMDLMDKKFDYTHTVKMNCRDFARMIRFFNRMKCTGFALKWNKDIVSFVANTTSGSSVCETFQIPPTTPGDIPLVSSMDCLDEADMSDDSDMGEEPPLPLHSESRVPQSALKLFQVIEKHSSSLRSGNLFIDLQFPLDPVLKFFNAIAKIEDVFISCSPGVENIRIRGFFNAQSLDLDSMSESYMELVVAACEEEE